jgi:hypothetical protein
MSANVKPLTHWLIQQGFTVRFGRRSPHSVQGIITAPEGQLEFDYDPNTMTIRLPEEVVVINQYGWETNRKARDIQDGSQENRND